MLPLSFQPFKSSLRDAIPCVLLLINFKFYAKISTIEESIPSQPLITKVK